jgi:hypothetical protein
MTKTTKKQLLDEIDEKVNALNLLRSALQVDPSRKPETLSDYAKRFDELLKSKSKTGKPRQEINQRTKGHQDA